MRLWHKDLLDVLPRQQLLGQWRECHLIAKEIGKKGTPNHILVNRVIEYGQCHFESYCNQVQTEMQKRGYHADMHKIYQNLPEARHKWLPIEDIFPEWHNEQYLIQCLYNLQEKHDCKAIPDDEWAKIAKKYPKMK